jgi:phytoene dehydrogenase-like protein
MAETRTTDVVVIGGGLSGLTAAAFLAQAGRKVLLFEKTHTLGGRAVTQTKNGFSFNLGPHALYQGGPGIAVLRELNVPFTGSAPSGAGAYAVDQGVLHTFPAGFVSLLTTGLLRWQAKVELARMLGSFHKLQPGSLQHVTVQEWLNRTVRNLKVRQVLQAFFRVTSYANAPDEYSAGTAIAQAQAALSKNVLYLDGGWQTLVDGLRRVGERAGVVMEAEQRITSVEYDTVVQGVRLANSSFIPASAVVITGSPEEAVALLPKDQTPLHARVKTAIPIKAACLDVGLSHLPRSHARFALGIDQPLYFSVHSAVAKLGPDGGAVIHVAKYLNPATATDAKTDEQELEQLLDLMQPGWRNVAVERRFLPHMTVYHALPTARMKGLAGRPGPAVSGVDNLYIAGDWVGAEGMLADASLASAKRAATLILQRGGTLMEQAA